MTTVLVTGGRDYDGRAVVFTRLDAIDDECGITLLVHGACTDKETGELTGADRWAEEWAIDRQCAYFGVPAKWRKYGLSAGPRRNEEMPTMCKKMGVPVDLVVAFPGGRGTGGMVNIAERLGIAVRAP
jgi:hypothetical protein